MIKFVSVLKSLDIISLFLLLFVTITVFKIFDNMQVFGEDCTSESESDEDNAESGEDSASESEIEDENEAGNEDEWTSSTEARSETSDDEVDVETSAEALKKLVPYNLEEFEKVQFHTT